jgi:hypothetical protein
MRIRLTLLPLVVAAVALAAPARADDPVVPALTYTLNEASTHPTTYAAAPDGSGAHAVGAGVSGPLSPNGRVVLIDEKVNGLGYDRLVVRATADGGSRRVLTHRGDIFPTPSWSSDSALIAMATGPDQSALLVFNAATGHATMIATGFIQGISFEPGSGHALVFDRSPRSRFNAHPKPDLYIATPSAHGYKVRRLTRNHRSQQPVWGPHAIAYSYCAPRRNSYPNCQIALVGTNGRGAHRITHVPVSYLLQGLAPIAWSADGSRLVADFGGQDTDFCETVNPRTGAVTPVDATGGFICTALSKDGSTILGSTGGYDPGDPHAVVAADYVTHHETTLAAGGTESDWNR